MNVNTLSEKRPLISCGVSQVFLKGEVQHTGFSKICMFSKITAVVMKERIEWQVFILLFASTPEKCHVVSHTNCQGFVVHSDSEVLRCVLEMH
jgi:hypothetical protein